MPFPLAGVVRDYAWGSTTAIPALLGVEPDGRPVAELWFGAHPDAPSPVGTAGALDALIEADPDGLLGADLAAAHGPRLPFLLKILAADRALSIQVHPTDAQARAGYAREQAENVPDDRRTYRDPHHKPELIYALTPFRALCGFRPVEPTAALLERLGLADLRADVLADDGLRLATTRLLTLADADRAALVDTALAACRDVRDGPFAEACASAVLAGGDFPGDIGAVVALLLNTVLLEPGEAIFLGAGTVHAYLRGTGVEILANSDNVLRCGLTPKHVDVPELLRVARFEPLPDPVWPARAHGGGALFAPPVTDFALWVTDGPGELPPIGPRIVLALGPDVTVDDAPLPRAHAVFVPSGERARTSGRVAVASPGRG